MHANDYQTAAARTLISEPDHPFTGNELMLMWCGLGLSGEAGEVLDLLKKGICHQHGLDREKLVKELGDLLWYAAGIATLIDASLSEIMQTNIDKLNTRYPNGYNAADSQARVDTKPKPKFGDAAQCSMCGERIVFIDPYWDHVGPNKPRHPATPAEYAL